MNKENVYDNFLESVVPIDSASHNDECWRLYRDGLFCWSKSMFENTISKYQGTSSKINLIWNVTEMLLFVCRVYGKILPTSEKIYFQLTISGSNGRVYQNFLTNFSQNYKPES